MTSEIINTLRENFLFFLIRAHNFFKEQENVYIVSSQCGHSGEYTGLLRFSYTVFPPFPF